MITNGLDKIIVATPKLLAIYSLIYVLNIGIASTTTDTFNDAYYDSIENVLEPSYHGLIKENETVVEITPLIKVNEMKICDFHIIKKGNREIPFQIELVNSLGILKAKKTLNCEKHKNYKFDIAAVFCDGSHSKSSSVHISVIDINEYSPTFLQPSYVIEVDEGRLYQEIIRVEALDRDCTPLFGDVCKYEILNNDQPFTINNEGSIRNTEPLSHKISHNHILSVIAFDCAMKQSSPIMVTIRVRRVCEARMMSVPERIDYTGNTLESVYLFPKMHLELCDMQCKDDDLRIQSVVSLKTKHISFGCDRDLSHCVEKDFINLLPKDTEWTKDLMFDEGPEPVFHFDGITGAMVPSNILSQYDFALHPFSISTIFRHHMINEKHTKEHIVCSADDHKMNRHHMALFVRNCRLILLLRKNFNKGDLNIFSPAEWRWKIPQVCDNEWHKYTITVDLPSVELYIDGEKFQLTNENRHNNPEVIDDWPLHAAHGVNTTLTIGACYQGAENRMKHGFRGDISEIKLAMQKPLTPEQIKCGTDCAEHLISPSRHYLEPSQKVQSNYQLNEIKIEGTNKVNIELLLQKIQYINTKQSPTIGRRNIEVRSTVSCPNKKAIRLPTMETYIMLNPGVVPPIIQHVGAFRISSPSTLLQSPLVGASSSSSILSKTLSLSSLSSGSTKQPNTEVQKTKIVIEGNPNYLVTYPDIKQGVRILANISISIYSGGRIHENVQKMDSCSVIVFPSLNPDHEEITIDNGDGSDDLESLSIKTNINKDGAEVFGYDSVTNYLKILHSLVYTNKKPAYYLNRVFKLVCTQMNSHFKSVEYTKTLTVLHPKQSPSTMHPENAAQIMQEHDTNMFAHAMVHSHDVQESSSKMFNIIEKTQSSYSTMLIVVISISFLTLIFGVSIIRIRNNLNKNQDSQPPKVVSEQQLDWDDSALTITINPMQNDSLSDESSDSENSESEDEANNRYRNVSQLEWDNSTM